MKNWIGYSIGLIALGLGSTAQAAGYYFSDIGVRSFSRGGAFVAGNDDLTALFYNPAALTRLRRNQVMINVAGVQQSVRFQRAQTEGAGPLDEDGTPTTVEFGAIENKAPTFVIPHFGLSSRLGTDNTTFAFGFYPPYAPDLSYDADGPQRYSLIDVMVIQTALGPSIAHRVNDWISVGAGVAWNVLLAEQELAISVPFHSSQITSEFIDGEIVSTIGSPTPNEDPSNDVSFKFAASDWKGWSWNAAVMLEPKDSNWAAAIMVQPPVSFDAEGNMEADFSSHVLHTDGFPANNPIIASASSTDPDVRLQITMPLIVKSGFAFRPGDKTEIEFSAIWQNWSSIQNVTITDLDLLVDINQDHTLEQVQEMDDVVITDDVVLPASYQDAWSLRVGGEHDVNSTVTVRAGTFYETSAIPSKTQSVSLIDGKKIGYGVGGSYRPTESLSIDFGLSQSFLTPTEATNSEVKQISVDALTGEFLDGTTIANGTYESSVLLMGGGVTYVFGTAD